MTDRDLPAVAVELARLWKYPPEYARLCLESLRVALGRLGDPARRAEADEEARRLGLTAEEN